MLTLKMLGGLTIEAHGAPLGGAASRRKPLALLALLGVSRQGISRDMLAAYLWPESDEDHAQAALRQTLYALRRDLGVSDVVLGAAELRLNSSVITSDVEAFEAAIDQGKPERAVALYTGPFLRGVHFSGGAHAFDEWAESERRRIERRAHLALETLATDAERRNDHEVAASWWRKLAEQDRLNSRIALGLVRALAASGDPAGALREAHEHESRVRREVGTAPDPAIVAFAQRLRSPGPAKGAPAMHGVADASMPARSAPLPPAARIGVPVDVAPILNDRDERSPSQAPTSGPPTEQTHHQSGFRGSLAAGAMAVAVVASLTIGVVTYQRSLVPTRREPATSGGVVIAVLPFAIHGAGEGDYLREAMLHLLSRNIDGAGDFRAVDSRSVLTAASRDTVAALEAANGVTVARRLGADLFVTGSVTLAGDRLRVSATMYGTTRPDEPLAQASADGTSAEIIGVVDRLTLNLISAAARGDGATRLRSVAAVTTTSIPALKAYLEGDGHYRNRRWSEAVDAFRRAVALDTSFALAYYRLSVAADWASQNKLAFEAAERAGRFSDRLSPRDATLLRALAAWRRADLDSAEMLYRKLLDGYPQDVEARYQLGEVLFHSNPLRGRSMSEARFPFEHVHAVTPDDDEPISHLVRIAALEKRKHDLLQLMQSSPAARAAAATVHGDTNAAYDLATLRDSAYFRRELVRLRASDVGSVYFTATRAAVYFDNLPAARAVARLLTEPERAPWERALGHVTLGELEAMGGRWRRARQEFARAAAFDPVRAAEHHALLVATWPIDLPAAEVTSARDVLQRTAAISTSPTTFEWHVPFTDSHAYLRTYLHGLLSARAGNQRAANRAAAALASAAGPTPEAEQLAHALSRSVRAFIAWREGRARDALAELEGAKLETSLTMMLSPFGSRSWERYVRADALRTLGREREALGWYGSMSEGSTFDLAFLAPSLVRQAEIHDRIGERDRAAQLHARANDIWRDADSDLLPLSQIAPRRLAGLASRATVAR
jgi:DNA-binding SARP family transcriptional activator/tetratricopeptide (TPR) repeat protein/TolB-like protein